MRLSDLVTALQNQSPNLTLQTGGADGVTRCTIPYQRFICAFVFSPKETKIEYAGDAATLRHLFDLALSRPSRLNGEMPVVLSMRDALPQTGLAHVEAPVPYAAFDNAYAIMDATVLRPNKLRQRLDS